ncbi:MAG: 2'-5' RNA ligase family protein [Deltaproteobacteria bacterium]|jgi:2'-5' RNA ligase|nr:2'-5' RNA ligase family protein [Deltaproteobacteria bacterium]MBW2532397.1 2'-5' RNA ligase family protein [Deltaproteobacteria bacterium]
MTPNWFIGLPVEAGTWFPRLIRGAPESVRVFHPDDIHITVAFLGSCGPEAARRAWSAVTEELHRGVRPVAPLQATLGGVEPMGNPKRPSALSVVLSEGARPVAELMEALRHGAWAAADARPDRRPALPHITIARPKRKASGSERQDALRWAAELPAVGVGISLDRVALLTWAEDRRLRQFRAVEQSALAPPAPSATPPTPPSENDG